MATVLADWSSYGWRGHCDWWALVSHTPLSLLFPAKSSYFEYLVSLLPHHLCVRCIRQILSTFCVYVWLLSCYQGACVLITCVPPLQYYFCLDKSIYWMKLNCSLCVCVSLRCDGWAGGAPSGSRSRGRAGCRRGGCAGLSHGHRHHGVPVWRSRRRTNGWAHLGLVPPLSLVPSHL